MQEIPLSDVAIRLNKSEKQIRRYINAGWLNTTRKIVNGYPKTFVNWYEGLEAELEQKKRGYYQEPSLFEPPTLSIVRKNHKALLDEWESWGRQGFLSNTPWSEETTINYRKYLEKYFTKHIDLTSEGFIKELSKYSIDKFGVRKMFYYSIISFAKFLIKKKIEPDSILEELKVFKPVRSGKPKRTVLKEPQIEKLFKFIDSYKYYTPKRRALNKAIIATLLYTGIRNTELRTLLFEKVDIDGAYDGNRRMLVLGKGNKWRAVGIPEELAIILKQYLKYRPNVECPYFFMNEACKQFSRREIDRKIRNIRKELGFDITPHGFRRTFVTLAAKRGKSLLLIRDAVGHEDIKITEIYSMLGNDDVVEAMQTW